MAELTNAVRLELLGIGVTPMLLIGALAWWFRARLKQSLAKALNAHVERVKVEAQREIEAYKVSLIATVERHKAQSGLKKAIAIKHATLEYEALVQLHARLGDVSSSIMAMASLPRSNEVISSQLFADGFKQLVLLGEAIDAAHLFVQPQSSIDLIDLKHELLQLVEQLSVAEGATVVSDDVRNTVNQSVAMFRNLIRARVAGLVELADGSTT